MSKASNTTSPLANALRAVLAAQPNPAPAQPTPPTQQAPRATPAVPIRPNQKTAPSQPQRDPLATIAQPVNAPLPKPMAQALSRLQAVAQMTQVAANPNTPAAPRSTVATRPQAATPKARTSSPSFAQLMHEQDRGPPPAALLEKASENFIENGSIQPNSNEMKRWTLHTQEINDIKGINKAPDAYTAPPGKPLPAGTAHAQVHALHALKAIQKTMRTQQAKARAIQAEQALLERQRTSARDVFVRTVGPVQALPDPGKVLHHQARDPVPTQRLLDEQAVLRESLSDEFDAGTLLETDDKLSFLRPGVGLDVARKLRRGEWAIQAQIDLHGLRTDAAREALGGFIRDSHRSGLRCVRVIHGKGMGSPGKTPVLKSRVQRWLVQKAEVMAYVQANPNQGGDGAVLVLLQPSRRQWALPANAARE